MTLLKSPGKGVKEMARPKIHISTATETKLSTVQKSRTQVIDGPALDKRLRQKRSSTYIDALTKLDAGGVTCIQHDIEALKQAIQAEFTDLEPYQWPLGIISKCYLGAPYEVHTLDTSLDIIEHYKRGERLPSLMERARSIALHPTYAFIEIYSDTLRAVSENGDVAVIKG